MSLAIFNIWVFRKTPAVHVLITRMLRVLTLLCFYCGGKVNLFPVGAPLPTCGFTALPQTAARPWTESGQEWGAAGSGEVLSSGPGQRTSVGRADLEPPPPGAEIRPARSWNFPHPTDVDAAAAVCKTCKPGTWELHRSLRRPPIQSDPLGSGDRGGSAARCWCGSRTDPVNWWCSAASFHRTTWSKLDRLTPPAAFPSPLCRDVDEGVPHLHAPHRGGGRTTLLLIGPPLQSSSPLLPWIGSIELLLYLLLVPQRTSWRHLATEALQAPLGGAAAASAASCARFRGRESRLKSVLSSDRITKLYLQ